MTITEFVTKYLGKKTDYDGVYGVQCVDLIKLYVDKVLNLTPKSIGNAKYYWLNRNTESYLYKNFYFIKPTFRNVELREGDIGVRTSGTDGHIFIIKKQTKDKIYYYDQNYNGTHAPMTLREKPYNSQYINGVLRPKTKIVKVSANGGLHCYKNINDKSYCNIPNNTKVELLSKDITTKKISGKTYYMSTIYYKDNMFYVATKYLK